MSEKEIQINKVKEAIKKLEAGPLKKTCIALYSLYLKRLDNDEHLEKEEKKISDKYEKDFPVIYEKVFL